MALSAEQEGGVLYELHSDFETQHPTVRLNIAPKGLSGPGSLVNLLLATKPIAPAELPDVVAVDACEIEPLIAAGLFVPLDDLISARVWEDLFPFALDAAAFDGEFYAVPFQADLTFIVYDSALVPDVPTHWADLAGLNSAYVFPAGEGDGSAAEAFLIQYLALDGVLAQADGTPFLDASIAAQVLASYRDAIRAGIVPTRVRELKTLQDSWSLFLAGEVGMANVGSHQIQRQRTIPERTHFAPIPNATGHPLTLARSRVWAITATDPERQQLAAQYITEAIAPERVAAWARAAAQLPAQRSAVPLAIEADEYLQFVTTQLAEAAHPCPRMYEYGQIQGAITRAIIDVLDGVSTPEDAAASASAMVSRLR